MANGNQTEQTKQIVNINVKQVYAQDGKRSLSIVSNVGANYVNWDNWKKEVLPKAGDIVKAEVEQLPDYKNQKTGKFVKQFKLLRILEVVMRAQGPTTAPTPRISSKPSTTSGGGQGKAQGTLETPKSASPVSFPSPLTDADIDKALSNTRQRIAREQGIIPSVVDTKTELFAIILRAEFEKINQSFWQRQHLAEQSQKQQLWGNLKK